MKKIYLTAFVTTLFVSLGYAQSQRLVLLEHFTGASCPPCATYNPGIQDLLDSNPDKITSIKYQLAPPGTDPMYSHNPQHSGSRANYYNVTGIPNSVLDGNFFNDHPANWNINTVNNRYDDPSPFDIDISYTVTPTTIDVEVTVTASQDFEDSNLRLHTVVVEEEINFSSPAGSNGETEFHNVMKRMLPNQSGTSIESEWVDGESMTYNLSWNHSNVYSYPQLAIVAFIQNNTTKEVHQAAFSNDALYDSPYSIAAENYNLNLPQQVCEGMSLEIEPSISVLNLGTEALTSLDILATVNGENYNTSWTGNIELMEELVISLDPLPLTISENSYDVNVSITSLNGVSSETELEELDGSFSVNEFESTTSLTLDIDFDCWPNEITWSILDAETQTEVAAGGPYGQNEVQGSISENIDLPADGCYIFNVKDSYGDGLNGVPSGCPINGSINLYDDQDNEIYAVGGSSQFSEEFTAFSAQQALNSSFATEQNMSVKIFPNPTSSEGNFSLNLPNPANVVYEIVDIVGKTVMTQNAGILPSGESIITTDLSNLLTGVYIVNIRIGDSQLSEKLIIRK
jgi:hypothetical protein